jgi:protein CpxP
MKSRYALLALAVVCAAAPLAAQGGGGGGRRGGGGGMNVDQMTTQYSLSADQKTKTVALIKIFTDGTAATQAWMMSEQQAGAARNADSTQKVTDARTKFNADFKALLTPDQSKTFDSVQTANAGRRRGGGGGGR